MNGHSNGRSIQGTMEIGNENHRIKKWDFDLNYGELDRKLTHLTDSATGTINRMTVCERDKWIGKIHLLNCS